MNVRMMTCLAALALGLAGCVAVPAPQAQAQYRAPQQQVAPVAPVQATQLAPPATTGETQWVGSNRPAGTEGLVEGQHYPCNPSDGSLNQASRTSCTFHVRHHQQQVCCTPQVVVPPKPPVMQPCCVAPAKPLVVPPPVTCNPCTPTPRPCFDCQSSKPAVAGGNQTVTVKQGDIHIKIVTPPPPAPMIVTPSAPPPAIVPPALTNPKGSSGQQPLRSDPNNRWTIGT